MLALPQRPPTVHKLQALYPQTYEIHPLQEEQFLLKHLYTPPAHILYVQPGAVVIDFWL